MKYPISLAESNGMTEPSPLKMMDEKRYPCLHLSWDEKYDLPDDGVMTVKFHKKNQTDTVGDHGIHQSVDLEILSIEEVEAEESDEPEKSDREKAGEALDKYAEEASEE